MTWAILWARPDSFEPSTFAGNKHGSEFSQKLEDDMRLFLEPSPQLSTMFLRGSGRVCGALPTLAKSHGGCVLVAGNDGDDGDWGWLVYPLVHNCGWKEHCKLKYEIFQQALRCLLMGILKRNCL